MSSDASSHALAPGTRIRDYTILSVLGTGGFSIVYRAMDNSLEREVAIKEYFPASFALRGHDGTVQAHSRETDTFRTGIVSFMNEGKLLAQFDHPALVRVYRCWEERGTAYLAMRLYTGVTLRDAVKSGVWTSDATSLRALLMPLCDTLELLHAANCYHRDVAPDNILLVEGQAPVLLDFGAARRAIEGTQVFTAILKPGYAPIEQYGAGELKQGPWTDIYALAGVVHFTLTGDAPTTAISRMLRDVMPRPQEAFAGRLPERWLDALERALAVKPENRPQTIAEFRDAFGWDEFVEPPAGVAAVSAATPVAVADARPVASALEPTVVSALPPANRSVTVPPPRPVIAPAAPPVPAPALVVDDDQTVVWQRSPTPVPVPVPAPATRRAPAHEPVAQAPSQLKSVVASKPQSGPSHEAATGSGRRVGWIAAAVVGLVVASTLIWRFVTPAEPEPTRPATASVVPSAPTSRDTSSGAKPSVPVQAPVTLPTAPVAPVVTDVAAPDTKSNPVTTAVEAVKSPLKTEQKQDNGRRFPLLNKLRQQATTTDENGETVPRITRRPPRCIALLESFQLGAALSDEDNRFIRERCK